MSPNLRYAATVSMALSIIFGSVAHHAPMGLPYLWVFQTVADICGASGLAALFMSPPVSKPPAP